MESYYDAKHPGSFGGVKTFQRHVAAKGKDVENWLQNQDAYTLHKPIRLRFRRRKTFSVGINDLWQADLADLSALSKYNDKFKYLLTCIDVFSKRAWAVPVKSKSSADMCEAFSKILVKAQPTYLQTDKGSEFLNRPFQSLLRQNAIAFYTSENSDIKASVVERFNRSLKTRMWKYFSYKNTYRYIDVLQDLLDSYNNTYHRSIGMTPLEVCLENEFIVRNRLYGEKKKPAKWKYSVGDKVRICKTRIAFQKGYLPSWSEEIFTIVACIPTDPVTYEVSDLSGQTIKGKFYEPELQRIVKDDDVYKVEKVLKSRKRGGKMEYLVKWKGYDSSFNSWTSDIFDV
jgi:Integrase core domain/Chromo (CHRromatin Organisation MOdifier) domain